MQTLHPREKVCIKSACQIFENVQTFEKSAVCANCRLFEKKYASILHKVCKVCTCSASSLQANGRFVWEQPPVLKMQTFYKLFVNFDKTLVKQRM